MNAITTPNPTTDQTDTPQTTDTGEDLVHVRPGSIDGRVDVEAPTTVSRTVVDAPHPPTVRTRSSDEAPHRRRTLTRTIALGLGAIAATGISIAVLQISRDDAVAPAPTTVVDDDAQLRELVERGLIPAKALEPVVDEDAQLRELVERGLIPAKALEPVVDEDAQLRELVERGLIPAKALEPAPA
jgi:hypothetical protein